MPAFTFTGDQTANQGTSFDFLSDIRLITGVGGYVGPHDDVDLYEVSMNSGSHRATLHLATDRNGVPWFTGITGQSTNSSGELTTLLTGVGFRQATPFTYENFGSVENSAFAQGIVENIFSGSDDFSILGTISSIWGDYASVPLGRTVELGDDFFTLGRPGGAARLNLASGYGSVTVFGDAQTAGAGTTSRAGDDIIDGRPSGVPLVLYGDFQSVVGDVTYGNDYLTGSSQSDTLYGDSPSSTTFGGDDTLFGQSGNDFLFGGGGDDILQGGSGADYLDGGAGIDIASYSNTVTVDLSDTALNTGDAEGDTFIGIEGLRGSATSFSNSGDDDLRGSSSSDRLYGMSGRDTLRGRGGADLLDGGAGADTMEGGADNDTYIVDNAGDQTIEAAGGGTDIVKSWISWTLADNIERLQLLGVGNNATGNGLDNQIYGNAGNNSLNGSVGADRMEGFAGNDSYFVDNAGDQVIEAAGGGTDTVRAWTTWTLGANLERLVLLGTTQALNGAGNSLNNELFGNAGNNRLAGWAGNDTLTGGAGMDTFIFNTALNATTNRDTITDFSVVDDTIRLENSIFTAIGPVGTLAAAAFHIGTAATTAAHRIIYNSATGTLTYDSNGSAAGGATQFAILDTGLALTNADFLIS